MNGCYVGNIFLDKASEHRLSHYWYLMLLMLVLLLVFGLPLQSLPSQSLLSSFLRFIFALEFCCIVHMKCFCILSQYRIACILYINKKKVTIYWWLLCVNGFVELLQNIGSAYMYPTECQYVLVFDSFAEVGLLFLWFIFAFDMLSSNNFKIHRHSYTLCKHIKFTKIVVVSNDSCENDFHSLFFGCFFSVHSSFLCLHNMYICFPCSIQAHAEKTAVLFTAKTLESECILHKLFYTCWFFAFFAHTLPILCGKWKQKYCGKLC